MRMMFVYVISSYVVVNSYLFVRGWQALPSGPGSRLAYTILFWPIALSFLGSRVFESSLPPELLEVMTWVGSFWLAAFFYLFLLVLLVDILRAINHFLPFFPGFITENHSRAKHLATGFVLGLTALIVAGGFINARNPKVTEIEISINKEAGTLKHLNIALAADIHAGIIVGSSWLKGIVEKINALSPDIVLLPGDIIDDRLELVAGKKLEEELRRIQAPLGVFAALGNHEYICCEGEAAIRYLTEQNITVLRDESLKINDSFFLIGRDDFSADIRKGEKRKDLEALMDGVDRRFPVILMDHQPHHLGEAAGNGVDLQLSGHTHNGQMWPFNYIIGAMFELAWGYKRIGDTHYYVTNGAAVWGPPVRVGHRPEIVFVRLSFQ